MTSSDGDGGARDGGRIGAGYPRLQLSKALLNASATGNRKSSGNVERWQEVIAGMLVGDLDIGSRTPVHGTPAWVTLEVVTGGFATGAMLAGGPLQPHEVELAEQLGFPINAITRAHLNAYHLSEEGVARLQAMAAFGDYRVAVPEEGALLVVAWLLGRGEGAAATSVLDAIHPFFDRLRFFPRPAAASTTGGEEVCRQTAGEIATILQNAGVNARIATQAEAIEVWIPLYDRMVALLFETVRGEAPRVETDAAGKPVRDAAGRYRVGGGTPCGDFPEGWRDRARGLLAEHRQQASQHGLCKRRTRKGTPYARLLTLIECCAERPDDVSERDRGYARLALARFIAKRGAPGSKTCREQREIQLAQCPAPLHRDIAAVLADRLAQLPQDRGLADISIVSLPVTAEEAAARAVPEGTAIPRHFMAKVERALSGTIEELVVYGIIPSGDVLADVLPQMTGTIIASSLDDPDLRQIYGRIYQAFRRRRSLLLLDLESQVHLKELPWIAALGAHLRVSDANRALVGTVLSNAAVLALEHFPYAILPNKLIRETASLAHQAAIEAPFVYEVAIDIFTGRFSPVFAHAAHIAALCLQDTLYARYYDIDYSVVRAKPGRRGKFEFDTDQAQVFSELCVSMAGEGGNLEPSVASNGRIIEQQQIITSQNLAVLFMALDLREVLQDRLPELAKSCFRWLCRRQQIPLNDFHAGLVMIKNSAYAWRQMLFFMALLSRQEQYAFLNWLRDDHFLQQSPDFIKQFKPAVDGLAAVYNGGDVTDGGGRRFLGWVEGYHWLMPRLRDYKAYRE